MVSNRRLAARAERRGSQESLPLPGKKHCCAAPTQNWHQGLTHDVYYLHPAQEQAALGKRRMQPDPDDPGRFIKHKTKDSRLQPVVAREIILARAGVRR